jgi:hypothetical protein
MRAGDRYRDWELLERIDGDRGYNAQVWRCKNEELQTAAIKLLKPSSARSRIERFRDEIGFLLSPGADDPGVLPILDSHLPDDPKEQAWFVMPEARPIRKALGCDPLLEHVVVAAQAISATLARLAAKGIGHRDIKPDNLFERDGTWLVGDFGLVTYPDKEARTKHGRKVGPVDYMAPEMRRDADTAAAEPADVYSLAKVLWVLVTQQELPPPGPHRADEPAYALSTYIEGDRLPYLDRLVERTTANDPDARPAMRDFAAELERWLHMPSQEGDVPDLGEARDRLGAVAAAASRVEKKRAERIEQANEAFREWTHEALDPIQQQLLGIEGGDAAIEHSHALLPHMPDNSQAQGPVQRATMAAYLRLAGQDTQLHCAIGMDYDPYADREVALLAGHFLYPPDEQPIWIERMSVHPGSLEVAHTMAELTHGLHDRLPEAVAAYMSRVGA